ILSFLLVMLQFPRLCAPPPPLVALVVLSLEIVPVQVTAELPVSSSTSSPVIPFSIDLVTRALAQSSPRAEVEIPASGLPEIFAADQLGGASATPPGESTAELSSSFPPASVKS
ncbi:unnamed protein product, partial [Ilex paraguariensis]